MGCGASISSIRVDNASACRPSALTVRSEEHHLGEASLVGVLNASSEDEHHTARQYRQAPRDAAREMEKAALDARRVVDAMPDNNATKATLSNSMGYISGDEKEADSDAHRKVSAVQGSHVKKERSSISMIIPRRLPRSSDDCDSEQAMIETVGRFSGSSVCSSESARSWVSRAEGPPREDEAAAKWWYIQTCLEELRDRCEEDPKEA
mmetsp:Transcript_59951/g.106665  ORF Transcript_59951/g.106665 Transcript_59951/m.106665 type:complete len:208 (+) Transcript_59951:54-677(+)|eukprot:CAMPEP_0197638424 /NCGR_PEP_ID=MMETSP1338-20131121/13363_1 /TAXON_ID=43686 ORGANISM="Pelagodinium beii, Strain RCC1491" /NCGR_SAMPLE_ID=MMETSP1338 /ASSEMBLY_ACC=CAM_ASM_000754 /LENGTH=207 /DNA_ID=CAMNT_0043210999 /DNA_START=1 /DNA_END=624 /DNA_ORIENTATION=+